MKKSHKEQKPARAKTEPPAGKTARKGGQELSEQELKRVTAGGGPPTSVVDRQ